MTSTRAPSDSLDALMGRISDEFLDRLDRGEQPAIEDYARRYPEQAAVIRQVFPALELMRRPPADEALSVETLEAEPPGGRLGDFRLIREVGRGGMGVVYEAEQVSLGRRVALKVLPFAATLDPRHLQRFKNEAQAAAQLHHTNVVPVHYVGCERGVHFYAMQFIDGQTLADVIAELRKEAEPPAPSAPSDKQPIDPAATVDHAFMASPPPRRDIKPANLMVENSPLAPHGSPLRLWVTDFGLAHIQHAEGAITMSGDLIGTLRYMSPEQALAKRVIIDHRTDIYSLGATLYELLTLEPVFTGRDRQELLRQIAFEEPQPPRRLNKAIPAELETIVLKALEKNPADRYATAQDLAEDLRRFLADEPIRARRPRLVQRLRKWSRRHRTLTASVAVLLVTTLLLGGAWAWWHHEQQSARQCATEVGVTAALAQAETLIEEGYKQMEKPALMQAAMKQAELAIQRAEELMKTGVTTAEVDRQVGEIRDAVDAAMTDCKVVIELERIELERAISRSEGYDLAETRVQALAVLRSYGVDVGRPGDAAARVRGSRLRDVLLAALEAYPGMGKNQAEDQLIEKVLQAAEPTADDFAARWRAAVRRRDGVVLARMVGEPAVDSLPARKIKNLARDLVTLKEWGTAQLLLRPLQQRYPGNFWANHDLGMTLVHQRPPRLDEGARYLTAALALRSDAPGAYVNLGMALKEKGDNDGALREFQTAVKIDPHSASAHSNLGWALHNKGDYEGAIRECQAALKIKPNFLAAHVNLGNAFAGKRDIEAAVHQYKAALRIDPDSVFAHFNLGNALREKTNFEGSIRAFEAVLKIEPEHAEAHNNLGVVLLAKGDADKAMREFQAAIKIKPDYAEARNNLGNVLMKKGDLDHAVQEYMAALKIDPRNAPAHNNLGVVLFAKRDLAAAILEFRAALRIDAKYAEARCNLGVALIHNGDIAEGIRQCQAALKIKPQAEGHRNFATALAAKGEHDAAIRQLQTALEMNPNDAMAHYNLGICLSYKGDVEGAIREYQAALKIHPRYHKARMNLGTALRQIGKIDDAIQEFQSALRIDPKYALALYNLGNALKAKGRLEDAIRQYQAALELEPKHAEAHCNLGGTLIELGRFSEALAANKKGHEFGSKRSDWRYPSAKWVRDAERLIQIDNQLSKILVGATPATNPAEGLELARLCQRPYKQLYATGVRFFSEAFAAEPELAEDLAAGHRYDAACAAALVGCGEGKDAPIKEPERSRLRRQALDWLRADLTAYREQIEKDPTKAHPVVLKTLRHWQGENDFAGVRDSEALGRLPENERLDWKTLWEDVALLRKRAGDQFGQLWDDLQSQLGQARHRFIESKHEGSLTAKKKNQLHALELKAGKTYVLDLESKAFDAFLILEDGAGVKLAENDEISSKNLNSRIIYSPQKSGAYRVIATCFGPGGTGPYVLRIRELVEEPAKAGP